MRVQELAVVMNFARQVGVFFLCRLEHHLEHKLSARGYLHHRGCRISTFEPFVNLCVARYTFPKLPFPINRPTW